MCVVSMVADHYQQKDWSPYIFTTTGSFVINPEVTKQEFDQLKRTVEEMKELLRKAKIYDEKNNEPDCEIQEKIEFLKKIAEAVGVDLEDVLISKKTNAGTPTV